MKPRVTTPGTDMAKRRAMTRRGTRGTAKRRVIKAIRAKRTDDPRRRAGGHGTSGYPELAVAQHLAGKAQGFGIAFVVRAEPPTLSCVRAEPDLSHALGIATLIRFFIHDPAAIARCHGATLAFLRGSVRAQHGVHGFAVQMVQLVIA